MLNPFQTVISQYANDPAMLALVNAFNQEIDPSPLIDSLYNNIWNLETAVGYGLDVWGRIVGVSRVLAVQTGQYFGFHDGVSDNAPFNSGAPFYNGGPTTSVVSLADDAYRQLIFVKAAANIGSCDSATINRLLMALFGESGPVYCTDGGNMTMTYTFTFIPSPTQLAILQESGVLLKTAGVALSIVVP